MMAVRTRRGALGAMGVMVAALIVAPLTPAAAAPPSGEVSRSRVVDEPLVPMIEVDVSEFVDDAAELPAELETALQRDAGISGAEWLAQAEASEVGLDVVDALRDRIEVNGARLEGLELVVTVSSPADALVVESVGAIAEIGPAVDRGPSALEGLEPAADLRGGMPYYFPPGNRCSIGFVGIDTGTQQTQIMSAGHCEGTSGGLREAISVSQPNVFGPIISATMQDIGNGGLHVTDDYPNPGYTDETFYDFGITSVTGPSWTPQPEVVTWGGSTTGAPLASAPLVIRDAGPALTGTTLCKSGSTTGWTCGAIYAVDQVNRVGASTCPSSGSGYCVGSIAATICVRAGDSGGAAVVGNRAVGITSASTLTVGDCSSGGVGVFATLYSVDPSLEQVSKVYPRWEPLVAVEEPVFTLSGGIFSGTLDQGGTRHSIDVTFSTGETRTSSVASDGSWQVDTSTTSPVTKTYTVEARWGRGSFSSPVSGTIPGIDTARLSAADRYGTSVAVSQFQFPGTPLATNPLTPGVPVVYLASGTAFPDALSAGPAAALEGGPLLLTPASALTSTTAAELDRLNPQQIVIVGGTSVVSPTVASQAAAYTSGSVTRLGGANRYETSRLIAQRMLSQGLATGSDLWVATGVNFPDALSAGAAAASQGIPILLVNGTMSSIDAETASFVSNTLQSDGVFIAGGTGAVSEGIRSALLALPSTSAVTRAGGADRFATSLAINQLAYPVNAPSVFLAYGYNFPDALSASVVAGLRGAPLYMTQTSCVTSGIVDHILDMNPSQVTVFGGTSIVSDRARDLVRC